MLSGAIIHDFKLMIKDIEHSFQRIDLGVTYKTIDLGVCQERMSSEAAMVLDETNRCFFLHLGYGVEIHAFAICESFRIIAKRYPSSMSYTIRLVDDF